MPFSSTETIRQLEKLLSRDPALRDILKQNLPNLAGKLSFLPEADVFSSEHDYVILLDVPGVSADILTVEVEGANVIVQGSRPKPNTSAFETQSSERAFGEFSRKFSLPFPVDGDAVQAKLTDGVLRLTVPKKNTTRSVKIKID